MSVRRGSRVDSRALRQYVVRVDDTTGRSRGTGFFVAPGRVLTCAHVVEGVERVVVVPAAGGEPMPGEVAARSADRVPGPSAFWPFPDLALISIGTTDHRCVLLDARDPLGDECQAWGYSQREDGVAPTGSPASFRSEGVEGDGYLKLMAGQAAPGLSGAPLLCPERRAVIGVMTMTRDKRNALGGWASPVSALLTGGPGVPDDLLALGAEIMCANRAAVLQDRAAWHRVLPVDGSDDALLQPWGTFRKTKRPDPADLLLPGYGVVPYLFRDADVSQAVEWCESEQTLAISVVPGRGGAGKTRFAVELCRHMAQQRGWITGMWNKRHGEVADVVSLPLPRLIVVDYTESEDLSWLRLMLDRLRRQATDIAPVRVLLLTRAGVTGARDPIRTLREEATLSVKQILDDSDVSAAASISLDVDEREFLYSHAVKAFAAAWEVSTPHAVPTCLHRTMAFRWRFSSRRSTRHWMVEVMARRRQPAHPRTVRSLLRFVPRWTGSWCTRRSTGQVIARSTTPSCGEPVSRWRRSPELPMMSKLNN